jgi:hypothetical protein
VPPFDGSCLTDEPGARPLIQIDRRRVMGR